MKKIVSILLIVCILLSLPIPSLVRADEDVARLYPDSASLYQDGSVSLYIRAENLANVASLDFYVFYDSSVFTVSSAQVTGLLSGTLSDANITDQSVNFSVVSTTAVNGSGTVAVINLSAAANAEPGSYPISVAVGDVYDTGLQPLSVNGGSSSITVIERPIVVPTQYLYAYPNAGGSYTQDDTFTVSFYTSYVSNLGAMDIVSEYDPTLIRLDNVTLGSVLTSSQQALYSTNTNIPGHIKCSYIAPYGVSGYVNPLITYSFTVLQNIDSAATVSLELQNVCDVDRNAIVATGTNASVQLYQVIEIPEPPTIALTVLEETVDTVTYTVDVPGETNLAAGDFTFTFDNSRLSCSSITGTGQGLVVSNIKNDQGKATFSFILDGGLSDDATICTAVFNKVNDAHAETAVGLTGKSLVNDNLSAIEVQFAGNTATTHNTTAQGTCCERPKCPVCGLEYGEINPDNHDYQFDHWEWAEDNLTANAMFVCSRNPEHTIAVEAQVESVIGSSTYFESSTSTYTATATYNSNTYTDTKTVDVPKVTFNHSCTFSNDLTLNYYIKQNLLAGYSDIYLVVEKDCYDENGVLLPERNSVTITGADDGAYLKFKYKGIASYQACDNMYAVLYATKDGVQYESDVDIYSLKTYAYNRLEKSTDSLFKTMLVDFLNYCTESQLYFDYRTDMLPNADLTEEQRALATQSLVEPVDTSSVETLEGALVTFRGKSVVFDSNTQLKVYVYLDAIPEEERDSILMRFEYVGAYKPTVIDIPYSDFKYEAASNSYSAKMIEIAMYDARAAVRITVMDGVTPVSDTHIYSIEAYAARRLQSANSEESFKELLRMTLKYADSARVYFESQQNNL